MITILRKKTNLQSDILIRNGATAVTPWYLAGDIAASDCIAAYAAKGAASLAASKINLPTPGTLDLAPSPDDPSWNATDGWYGFTATQFLKLVTAPTDNWSVVVRYGNSSDNVVAMLFTNNTGKWAISASSSAYNGLVFFHSSQEARNRVTSGVVGMSGKLCYINGTYDVTIGAGAIDPGTNICIGGFNGWSGGTFNGSIQAIAFYDVSITAAQMLAVSTAMAAL